MSWERGKVPQAVKGIGLFLLTLGLQNLIGPFAEIGLAKEGALGKGVGNPSKIHRKIGPNLPAEVTGVRPTENLGEEITAGKGSRTC